MFRPSCWLPPDSGAWRAILYVLLPPLLPLLPPELPPQAASTTAAMASGAASMKRRFNTTDSFVIRPDSRPPSDTDRRNILRKPGCAMHPRHNGPVTRVGRRLLRERPPRPHAWT